MYTLRERIIAGICLLIALVGIVNLYLLEATVFGVSAGKLAILMFIPLGVTVYFIQARTNR
jgi:hypothetical protein